MTDAAAPQGETGGEKSYEIGSRAKEKEDGQRKDFEKLLRSNAETFMRRRRSNTITDADFDDAYGYLLSSQQRDWKRDVFGDIVVLFGAVLVGYGTNLATSDHPPKGSFLLILAGIVVGILGFVVQRIPNR